MTSFNLRELEKKAYLSYHQDGLLETGIGLYIFIFAIGMHYDIVGYLTDILPILGFGVLAAAKKIITIPRIGVVKFGPERKLRMKKEHLFFAVFFSITVFFGVFMFLAFNRMTPGVEAILKKFIMAPMGFLLGLGLAFVGFWRQLSRFYGYGILLIAIVFIGPLLGIEPPIYWGAGGLIISLFGLGHLVYFLIQNPRPKE